jgi:Flp pilus assembly protein TadD
MLLGYLYSKLDRDEDAIGLYREILSFEQKKPDVYVSLAVTYIHKEDYRAAEAVLKDALSRFKDNEDLLFNLAIVCEKEKRFAEMEAYLRKLIEINPDHANALNYLGYSYAEKGIHLEEAQALIQRAVALKPDNGYILDSLGWVFFKSGNTEEGLKTLLKAAELVKDDPTVFEHIGDVYHAMNVKDKAIEYWKKAIEFDKKGEDEGLKERVKKKILELR